MVFFFILRIMLVLYVFLIYDIGLSGGFERREVNSVIDC